MHYVNPVYRPGPTESNSLLLQVTLGCSYDKCTFCSFYKTKPFSIVPFEQVEEDLLEARQMYKHDPGFFLIDGEATCLPADQLLRILRKVREVFPDSPYTRMYGRFNDIAHMSTDYLKAMRELGVDFFYTGLESGSDKVLKAIEKGFTADDVRAAAEKMHAADIGFSTNIILGLGGVELAEEHIQESVRLTNEVQSPSGGCSALNPQYGTKLYEQIKSGEFELPTYDQIFQEERAYFEGIDTGGDFRVASGFFLPGAPIIGGIMPKDNEKIFRGLEDRERLRRAYGKEKVCIGGKL